MKQAIKKSLLKTLLCFGVFCVLGISVHAQSANLTVINNNACDVTFKIVASDNTLYPGMPCYPADITFDQTISGTSTCGPIPCSTSYTIASAPWDWANSAGSNPTYFMIVIVSKVGGYSVPFKVGDPSCTSWPSSVSAASYSCGGSIHANWAGTTLIFN